MNITKHRRTWFSISLGLVLASIMAVFLLGTNLGLDFVGGARWDLKFTEDLKVTTDDLKVFFNDRPELEKEVQIQESESGTFLVTIEDLDDKSIQAITDDLTTTVGVFEQTSYRKVDATIGQSFKKKSLYAIITALIGIILFVAFVFRRIPEAINPWRFGAVAIMALFHDIMIVFGVFVVLGYLYQVELDLPFVTAMLATLGFSVNDTIVILDRVRENIRLQKAHETFEDTVENSVQQTLWRSFNTSVSTLLPLLSLLFLGADALFYFVLALILGIMVGTYSSIFLAAPMLVEWKDWSDRRG